MEYTADEGFEELKPLLQSKKLILVTGSGVSIDPPSNLPTWDGLLESFIEFCKANVLPLLPAGDDFDAVVAEASAQRDRYPIRVASVLKRKLLEADQHGRYSLESAFQNWMSESFAGAAPNRNHVAIVRTDYPFILTSNYDLLLSKAAMASGYPKLAARAFSYHEPAKVASSIYEEEPCIIHLHGRYSEANLDRVVFTAQDYVRIKRANPGFTVAVQSLFLRYSTLFIGYGSSDPHLEDLLEELRGLFSYADSGQPRTFLFLDKSKADKILVKYKNQFHTDVIAVDDYKETSAFLERLQTLQPRA